MCWHQLVKALWWEIKGEIKLSNRKPESDLRVGLRFVTAIIPEKSLEGLL
jgi:hypothetical protein